MAIWAIGSDHAGYSLKQQVLTWLTEMGETCIDVGTTSEDSTDYPLYARAVRDRLISGATRGVLICGTGIGMSMAANRYPEVRAALCTSLLMAHMTRKHNDANVLVLGARIMSEHVARSILEAFMTTEFEGGRHQRRVDMLGSIWS